MVLRLVRVLEGIIGPAVLKEEAWVAVLRCVSGRSNFGTPLGTEEHLRNRMIVSWVRTGGEAGESYSHRKPSPRRSMADQTSLQGFPRSCCWAMDQPLLDQVFDVHSTIPSVSLLHFHAHLCAMH
jgi:hypothetical protein